MSRDFEALLRAWADEGEEFLAEYYLNAALVQVADTRQVSPRWAALRRLLPMSALARTFDRPVIRAGLLATAALAAFALVIGAYYASNPRVADPPAPRSFTEADVVAIATAAGNVLGDRVVAVVPEGFEGFLSDAASDYDSLHLLTGHPDFPAAEGARLRPALLTGLETAESRMFDAVGASGEPLPVTQPGGYSVGVTVASYADAALAADAFDAFADAVRAWEFEADAVRWAHGDEGITIPYSLPAHAHGRCFTIGDAACPQEVLLWRVGNLVVLVLEEGEAGTVTDDLVAYIDELTR